MSKIMHIESKSTANLVMFLALTCTTSLEPIKAQAQSITEEGKSPAQQTITPKFGDFLVPQMDYSTNTNSTNSGTTTSTGNSTLNSSGTPTSGTTSAISTPGQEVQTVTGGGELPFMKSQDQYSLKSGEKMTFKAGQPISLGAGSEDLVPTDDVTVAKAQVVHYPDSPEAHFILAVALTRTSYVEEALKEVRVARKLALAKGGPEYFDKMIKVYEDMLVNFDPNDNRIRYGLAWAYYMKGYLLAEDSQRQARAYGMPVKKTTAITPLEIASTLLTGQMPTDLSKINIGKTQLPHIPGALEKAQPTVIPQVKTYYEKAIAKLDEILAKNPKDIWAKVYRAHLYAEYTGDLGSSMKVWHQCALEAPNNPAPYFFLGEGYLRLGNLKQSLQYASKAVSLRMTGH